MTDRTGSKIIDRLMELQQPEHHDEAARIMWSKINDFVSSVTGSIDARIQIPHTKQTINVEMNGRILPLHSVGTGIEEVILIGSFCTMFDKQIICLEEPEIHLHPLLQRKLIRYLQKNTTNQYFVSTHSASFIDMEYSNVFHVTGHIGTTCIAPVVLRDHKHAICDDLGIRASDLIQSNCIIWVEGPSDRKYLNHWISGKAPWATEGIHYSIMFYGGRLLSHLSASESTSFIDLIAINKNSVILIDSDRRSSSDDINVTKQRIVRDFSEGRGYAWVTDGREVENYIPAKAIHDALSDMHKKTYDRARATGKYDKSYEFYRKKESVEDQEDVETDPNAASGAKAKRIPLLVSEVDKIEVATRVCVGSPDYSPLDLSERIDELCDFIRKANGM